MDRYFKIYMFDKNFKTRNAGGFPPPYMFSGKNPIGKIYIVSGQNKTDALNYFYDMMTDEQKRDFTVMVRGEVDSDGTFI